MLVLSIKPGQTHSRGPHFIRSNRSHDATSTDPDSFTGKYKNLNLCIIQFSDDGYGLFPHFLWLRYNNYQFADSFLWFSTYIDFL